MDLGSQQHRLETTENSDWDDGMQRSRSRNDIKNVKSWLVGYKELEKDIDNQIERLERLESRMYSVGSPTMDDIGGGHGSSDKDKMTILVYRKEKLKSKIMQMIDEQEKEHDAIEQCLGKLKNPDERAVIEMRYIDGEAWWDVSEMLFGSKKDYEERKESYLRRTTKLHGKALYSMSIVLDDK